MSSPLLTQGLMSRSPDIKVVTAFVTLPRKQRLMPRFFFLVNQTFLLMQHITCWVVDLWNASGLWVFVEGQPTGGKCCTCNLLWWADLGRKSGAHESCSITPRLDKGREGMMKGSWMEIRTGRSFTSYCHGQKQTWCGNSLRYYQSNRGRIVRTKTKS